MGSPESEEGRWEDEGPQYKVTLTEGYWLGETPVTQALWVVVMGANPSWFKGSERPVEMVSWEDCQEFLRKLNGMVEGLNVRLPTEAEWERACRAGTSTATWLGSNSVSMLDRIAWYSANSDGQTHAVRGKEPNPYGLHDMLGDVWEWCRDWYSGDAVDAERDPTGPVTGTLRVVRGASWSSPASRVRAGQRDAFSPAIHVYDLGFRLAQDQAEAS
jgi:formylglycine-generating enzyme required for sulfatase activity